MAPPRPAERLTVGDADQFGVQLAIQRRPPLGAAPRRPIRAGPRSSRPSPAAGENPAGWPSGSTTEPPGPRASQRTRYVSVSRWMSSRPTTKPWFSSISTSPMLANSRSNSRTTLTAVPNWLPTPAERAEYRAEGCPRRSFRGASLGPASVSRHGLVRRLPHRQTNFRDSLSSLQHAATLSSCYRLAKD